MLKCAFCPATADDVWHAIYLDWVLNYFVGSAEIASPVCADCQATRLFELPDGELAMREPGKTAASYR